MHCRLRSPGDEAGAFRQLGLVGGSGVSAAHTGTECTPWGHANAAALAAGSAGRRREPGTVRDNGEDTMNELEMLIEALGIQLEKERRSAVLAAFQPVAQEIAKLRSLDLTDVHPAVVFSPLPASQQD
jgi:hypothetical protein